MEHTITGMSMKIYIIHQCLWQSLGVMELEVVYTYSSDYTSLQLLQSYSVNAEASITCCYSEAEIILRNVTIHMAMY